MFYSISLLYVSNLKFVEKYSNLELLFSESFADVTFSIGLETIYAHRNILSKCEYFKIMFKDGWKESTSKVIEIKEVDTITFKLILKYIYTGRF